MSRSTAAAPPPHASPDGSTALAELRARAGRFLTFYLADEEYGVEILKVQEIIGLQPITRVPRTPAFIRGVINLRGKVIPIMDLRERFGMPSAESALAGASAAEVAAADAIRCIIVVQVALDTGRGADAARAMPVGVVVDRVSEVAHIGASDLAEAPSFGAGVRTEYLLGLGTTRTADGQGRVRLLLDIDRVLAAAELDALTQPAVLDAA